MCAAVLLGAKREAVAVEKSVAADGSLFDLANAEGQLVAQPCRVTEVFASVDRVKDGRDLIGALGVRLLDGREK